MANNTNTGTEGARLHRLLVGELAAAGCFRPAPMRSVAYGAFILAGYAGAYAALLSQSGAPARAAALMALAFLSVHAGFLAHEAGHGAPLGVGILHAAAPDLGLGASASDTGPVELRNLTHFTDAERSVFPDSSPAGCSDCYAHRVVDTGPVEMRKLSRVESSVFPKPSPGCTYGYGC